MKDGKRETGNGKRLGGRGSNTIPSRARGVRTHEAGFTLLELLVVMTIIGILAAIAVPALRDSPQRAREATLKEDLFALRSVIDQYHGDKGNYPADLQTLVTDGYIRKIPLDPMTKSAETWVVAYEEAPSPDSSGSGSTGLGSSSSPDPAAPSTPGIIDIHSGSAGKALDGTLYKDW
jgi:general secretion pathway protein G